MTFSELVRYVRGIPSDYEVISADILDPILKLHRVGEDALATATRVLVNQALHRTKGEQKAAADLLGLSSRRMNYLCMQLQLRPKDRQVQ
jgi:DNA-binding NtrC family response regulator